jgi:hypothetical protein
MRKTIATIALAGALLAPTAALAAPPKTGAGIGGDYGTRTCYITLDYFYVNANVSSAYPYVTVTRYGTVGGGVHCPLVNMG